MSTRYPRLVLKIRDGSRDLQGTVAPPRGEFECLRGPREVLALRGLERTVALEFPCREVAVELAGALDLARASASDLLAHLLFIDLTRLAGLRTEQVGGRHAIHSNMYVYAVKQWAGESVAVAGALSGCAPAGIPIFAVIARRARIHCRHELHVRRIAH